MSQAVLDKSERSGGSVSPRVTSILLAALFVFVVGAGVVFAGTSKGLVVGQRDAPSYMSSAESLHDGLGYRTPYGDPGKPIDFTDPTSPVLDFPPGDPAVLSVFVALGADVYDVARVLDALLVGTLGLLVLGVSLSMSPGLLRGMFASGVAMGLTIPYADSAMSEPLYGVLTVMTLYFAQKLVKEPHPAVLAVAAVLAAASVAVRTVGLALVACVALLAWHVFRGSSLRWWATGGTLVSGVAVFMGLSTVGTRTLGWHPPDLGYIKIFVNSVVGWLLPPVGTPMLRLAFVAVLLGGLLWWVVDGRADRGLGATLPKESWPGFLSAASHLAVLVLTGLFFSIQVALGPRLLYPVALSLLMAILAWSARIDAESRPRLSTALTVVGSLALVAAMWTGVSYMADAYQGIREFNSDDFLTSPTVAWIEDNMEGDQVFSNVPDGLWVAGVLNVRPLPVVYDPLSLELSDRLEEEMSQIEALVSEGAVVHYFREHARDYIVDEEQLASVAPCVIAEDTLSIVRGSVDRCG